MRCQGFDSGSNINVPNSQIESTRSDDKLNCRLNLVINPALDMLMNIMVQNCNFYDLTYANHEDFPSICTSNLFQLHAQFNSSNLPADRSCGYFFPQQWSGIHGRRSPGPWSTWGTKSTNKCCVSMLLPSKDRSAWSQAKSGQGGWSSLRSLPHIAASTLGACEKVASTPLGIWYKAHLLILYYGVEGIYTISSKVNLYSMF